MHEISLDGIFAAGEAGDNALDVKCRGDVTGQDVELGVFAGDEPFKSVRLGAEFQCFDQFSHSI